MQKIHAIALLLFDDMGKVPHIEILASKPLRELQDIYF